jgi:esterase/lipase
LYSTHAISSTGVSCAELAYISSSIVQQVFNDISNSGESCTSNSNEVMLQTSNHTVCDNVQFDIACASSAMEHLKDIQQPVHIHHGKCDAVVPLDTVEYNVKQAHNTR